MKFHLVLLAIALSVAMTQPNVSAQERMIGGGRLIRKLFGIDRPTDKPNDKPKENKKQPTLAAPKGTSNLHQFAAGKQGQQRLRQPVDLARPLPGNAPKTSGFGMTLGKRGNNLVVTRVVPNGNAHQSGIKVGDIVTEGGGISFKSVEEFQQLSEMLSQGDHLEFKLVRRGEKEKALIQFGNKVSESAPKDQQKWAKGTSPVNTQNHYNFLPTNRERVAPKLSSSAGGLKSVIAKPDSATLPTQVTNRRPTTFARGQTNSLQLQQKLQVQQQEIERLRREIQMLQRQNPSSMGTGLILESPN